MCAKLPAMPDLRFTRDALLAAPDRYVHAMDVRFQDVDAAGIVFYPRFLEYFHDAKVAFLRARGCPLDRAIAERQWAAPLKHAEADYFKPLRFGDRVEVALVAARLDGSDLVLGYRVRRGEEVVAVGQTQHVLVEPASFARVAPPARLAAALRELVGE